MNSKGEHTENMREERELGENRKKANLGKHKSAVLLHKAAESSTRSKKLSSHRKQA